LALALALALTLALLGYCRGTLSNVKCDPVENVIGSTEDGVGRV